MLFANYCIDIVKAIKLQLKNYRMFTRTCKFIKKNQLTNYKYVHSTLFKSFPFCILLYPLVKNFLEHPISSKSWSGLALSNVAAAASAAMLPITLYALLLWLA